MSCDACIASFDAADKADGSRVAYIDEYHPLCACQRRTVSVHSTGPVDDDETLVRILVSPIHVKNGVVRGAAFSAAEKSGLSMVRDSQASDAEIRKVAERLVEGARRNNGAKAGVLGVLLIKASTIRNTVSEGENDASYCVYDTALADNLPHAEAFQRVFQAPTDLIELRRATLMKNIGSAFVPASDFRQGLLFDLAPAV